MPRTKYEDTVYEIVEYSGKIFMYCSRTWNVIFPVVDIIRLLKKNTIIAYTYGKGQQMIKLYGQQYGHCMLGNDLEHRKNYLENLRAVKTIFIFSDEADATATNLINVAKKNNINIICYSNIDTNYHFYENDNEKVTFKKPEDVIEKMYTSFYLQEAKKYIELFDDFEIIENVVETKNTVLEECIEKIKKTEISEQKKVMHTKIFDPHMNKLKKMEYERSQRNIVFPDSVELLVKKEENKRKTLISRFFKK